MASTFSPPIYIYIIAIVFEECRHPQNVSVPCCNTRGAALSPRVGASINTVPYLFLPGTAAVRSCRCRLPPSHRPSPRVAYRCDSTRSGSAPPLRESYLTTGCVSGSRSPVEVTERFLQRVQFTAGTGVGCRLPARSGSEGGKVGEPGRPGLAPNQSVKTPGVACPLPDVLFMSP